MEHEAALKKMIKEKGVANLISIICHRWAGQLREEQIIDELAEMQVIVMQLQLFYGEERVQKVVDEKLKKIAQQYQDAREYERRSRVDFGEIKFLKEKQT